MNGCKVTEYRYTLPMIEKRTCEECGKEMYGSVNRILCSPKCRTRKLRRLNKEWGLINSAPKDGSNIMAIIEGHGKDNVIRWDESFVSTDDKDCGAWCFLGDDHPESWTDGVCWEVNEDGAESAKPTHWKMIDNEKKGSGKWDAK